MKRTETVTFTNMCMICDGDIQERCGMTGLTENGLHSMPLPRIWPLSWPDY